MPVVPLTVSKSLVWLGPVGEQMGSPIVSCGLLLMFFSCPSGLLLAQATYDLVVGCSLFPILLDEDVEIDTSCFCPNSTVDLFA